MTAECVQRCVHATVLGPPFLDEITEALATWERHLLAIVEPGENKVVSFRR